MRESIGGAWLFGIVAVFIFFFAAFLTYSINYTRAFNLKNEIINIIEKAEGYNPDSTVEGKINELVSSMGYNVEATDGIVCEGKQNGNKNEIKPGGYCLVKVCPSGNKNSNTHYKVTTYIALKLPVVNINVSIPISGETRTLYRDSGKYDCTDLSN